MDEEDLTIISPDTRRLNRIPPGQRLVTSWPVLHYGRVETIDRATWTFRVWGLVEKEWEMGFAEFAALPRVKVLSDVHCVTTWSKLNNLWEGVGTSTIGEIARPYPSARFVMVHGAGGFSTNLPVSDFFGMDCLFALMHDNGPLSAEHGGPVRLVVPRLYFWKSAKWVTGVEFIERNRPGFWEMHGYHMRGDPWKEERYG
ncbi:MAG: sulfite oxidase-like oxidoreductase [Syntrophorhabdales bacterium]|jgi:DMSO/TMAO reductase YedYZ molybdopterin-dependent catalytic subunit